MNNEATSDQPILDLRRAQQRRDPPTKLLALRALTLAFQIVKIGP